MLAYVLSPNENARPIYVGDLKALRCVIRERIPKPSRDFCRVTLEEYDTSKGSVLGMLNGSEPVRLEVKKKWRVSIRGRLIEIPIDED